MITLGGVSISDDMYLSGLESSRLVSVDQQRSIDGFSIIRIKPSVGGRSLTLGSQNRGNSLQGLWDKSTIDSIKSLELQAQPVILSYRGTDYTVYIVGTEFTPMLQFELESPTKKFTGSVSLLEV